MSFWPKSRYVASLEQQVAELKIELAERKQTILKMYDDMAELRLQLASRPTAEAKKNEAHPRSVNLLQGRSFLESAKTPIFEGQPDDKEN